MSLFSHKEAQRGAKSRDVEHRSAWTALVVGCVLFIGLPLTAAACEPVVQLAILWGGPGAFTLISLGATVLVKCVAFAALERGLAWHEAIGLLFIGNLYTTVIGTAIGISMSMPGMFIFVAPVLYAVSFRPAERFISGSGLVWASRLKPAYVVNAMAACLFASSILFMLSAGAHHSDRYTEYWLLKLGYIVFGLVIGIGLTAMWEEHVVAKLAAKTHPDRSYFPSVFRANYITFGVILLVLAAVNLPKRFGKPGFLTSFADHLRLMMN